MCIQGVLSNYASEHDATMTLHSKHVAEITNVAARATAARACVPAISVQAEHYHVGILRKYLLSALAVVDVPAGNTQCSDAVTLAVPTLQNTTHSVDELLPTHPQHHT
jgi:hypothetical protein